MDRFSIALRDLRLTVDYDGRYCTLTGELSEAIGADAPQLSEQGIAKLKQ